MRNYWGSSGKNTTAVFCGKMTTARGENTGAECINTTGGGKRDDTRMDAGDGTAGVGVLRGAVLHGEEG